jgi:hypothetical protein
MPGLRVRGGNHRSRSSTRGSERAREVVVASSALTSPSTDEIRLANKGGFAMGKIATVLSVDFSVEEDSIKLIEMDRQQ